MEQTTVTLTPSAVITMNQDSRAAAELITMATAQQETAGVSEIAVFFNLLRISTHGILPTGFFS